MKLPLPFTATKLNVNAIIETPKGSRFKYEFDSTTQLFKLRKLLPEGTAFPFDFGFVPRTTAPDGDPMDIVVISEAPSFSGCLLEARIIGIIEATQADKGKKPSRNDRLVGVPYLPDEESPISSVNDLGKKHLEEIAHFFKYYHKLKGDDYRILGFGGPKRALKRLKACLNT